jgi:hypothetical protein
MRWLSRAARGATSLASLLCRPALGSNNNDPDEPNPILCAPTRAGSARVTWLRSSLITPAGKVIASPRASEERSLWN